jgi:hypothetical protein
MAALLPDKAMEALHRLAHTEVAIPVLSMVNLHRPAPPEDTGVKARLRQVLAMDLHLQDQDMVHQVAILLNLRRHGVNILASNLHGIKVSSLDVIVLVFSFTYLIGVAWAGVAWGLWFPPGTAYNISVLEQDETVV